MSQLLGTQIAETDVNPIAAGAGFGWVSGTPANLGDGAATTCLFDLGPLWNQIGSLQIGIQSTAAGGSLSNISASFRDTPTPVSINVQRAANLAAATTLAMAFLSVTTANGGGSMHVKPMGRYLNLSLTNAAGFGAQNGAAKVTVVAYPHG